MSIQPVGVSRPQPIATHGALPEPAQPATPATLAAPRGSGGPAPWVPGYGYAYPPGTPYGAPPGILHGLGLIVRGLAEVAVAGFRGTLAVITVVARLSLAIAGAVFGALGRAIRAIFDPSYGNPPYPGWGYDPYRRW